MVFSAEALLLKKTESGWAEEKVTIDSIAAIRNLFSPYEDDISQVDINKYMKVYHSIKNISRCIEARVTDMECNTHYMASPLLLVECDDTKPVNLTGETLEKMRATIDFY